MRETLLFASFVAVNSTLRFPSTTLRILKFGHNVVQGNDDAIDQGMSHSLRVLEFKLLMLQ